MRRPSGKPVRRDREKEEGQSTAAQSFLGSWAELSPWSHISGGTLPIISFSQLETEDTERAMAQEAAPRGLRPGAQPWTGK